LFVAFSLILDNDTCGFHLEIKQHSRMVVTFTEQHKRINPTPTKNTSKKEKATNKIEKKMP